MATLKIGCLIINNDDNNTTYSTNEQTLSVVVDREAVQRDCSEIDRTSKEYKTCVSGHTSIQSGAQACLANKALHSLTDGMPYRDIEGALIVHANAERAAFDTEYPDYFDIFVTKAREYGAKYDFTPNEELFSELTPANAEAMYSLRCRQIEESIDAGRVSEADLEGLLSELEGYHRASNQGFGFSRERIREAWVEKLKD